MSKPSPTTEKDEKRLSDAEKEGSVETDDVNRSVDLKALHPLVGDREAERRLVRKVDIRCMPITYLIYLFTFIDRVNIGNANIAGLSKDLKLVGLQYNTALSLLYITYTLVEIPSNLCLKRYGARIWLPILILSFGIITTSTAFVKTYNHLIAVRLMLGLAEGGVLCGLSLWLSRFYRRNELVFRIGIFVSSASLAGAFGSLMASGFLSVGRIGTLTSWRTIFFAEGIITIGIAFLALLLITSEPKYASYLTEDEKALALARLQSEQIGIQVANEPAARKLIWQGILNINTWLFTLGFLLTNISVQGLSLFLPTIVKGLYPNLTTVQQQLRTAPPFAVSCLWSIFMAWVSDYYNRRAYVMMTTTPLAIIGYTIFRASTNQHARYGAAFLVTSGIFPLGPFFLAWGCNNLSPDTSRAVAAAIIPSISSIGSIAATFSYLATDAPNYPIGNSLNIASTTAVFIISILGLLYNNWENKQRALGRRDHRLNGLSDREIALMGNKHPKFVMTI